jgi:hypothetical protein
MRFFLTYKPFLYIQALLLGVLLTAGGNFEPTDEEVTLTITIEPPGSGTVEVDGEPYAGVPIHSPLNEELNIEALPDYGYVFKDWSGPVATDDNPLIFEPSISTPMTLTANFQLHPDFRILILQTEPEGAGITDGAGPARMDEETSVGVTPVESYEFVNWTDEAGNEVDDRPFFDYPMPSRAVTLTANLKIKEPEPPAEPEPVEVTFTVSMTRANGFSPLLDKVFFTGSMFDYAIPGENPKQRLEQTPDPMVFSQTLALLPGRYYYKFYLNEGLSGAEWPSSPIRIADVSGPGVKNVFYSIFGEHELTVSTVPTLSSPALVYPNPARTTLHIASEDGQPIFEIRLLTLQGQEVYHALNLDASRHQIYVGNLKSGLYLLQVLNPGGWSVARVQVMHQ